MGSLGRNVEHKLLFVAVWCAATLVAGAVTWSAVARLGHEGTTTDQAPMSQAEVRQVLAGLATNSSPQPTTVSPTTTGPTTSGPTTTGPTTSGPSSPPDTSTPNLPARKVRSWSLSGGHVTASCRGDVISGYATPLDGWSMEVDDAGPEKLKVEFSRGDDKVELEAECAAGIPTAKS